MSMCSGVPDSLSEGHSRSSGGQCTQLREINHVDWHCCGLQSPRANDLNQVLSPKAQRISWTAPHSPWTSPAQQSLGLEQGSASLEDVSWHQVQLPHTNLSVSAMPELQEPLILEKLNPRICITRLPANVLPQDQLCRSGAESSSLLPSRLRLSTIRES